ncbi:hypothetical protein Bbelb_036160 [Branchiostoma belcheri]|nr:hypothetical protein Bbelb_036160 [Branchiostoma belcheri]
MSRRPHKPTGDTPTPRSHVDVVTIGVLVENCIRVQLFQEASWLDTQNKKVDVKWARDETAALVKYIALYYSVEEGQPDEKLSPWPTTKKEEFWDRCAKLIAEETGKPVRAEREHSIRISLGDKKTHLTTIQSQFSQLTDNQQWDTLDILFHQRLAAIRPSLPSFVPHNFIKLAASAMDNSHVRTMGKTQLTPHVPSLGFRTPDQPDVMAAPSLRAGATLVGRSILSTLKKVKNDEQLPPDDQCARFEANTPLNTLDQDVLLGHLRRLTGEDPDTLTAVGNGQVAVGNGHEVRAAVVGNGRKLISMMDRFFDCLNVKNAHQGARTKKADLD